jgi:hypothetical protein
MPGQGGRAGRNLYQREVVMPKSECRREEEEGRRGGGRCSVANLRLNSICEHGCTMY